MAATFQSIGRQELALRSEYPESLQGPYRDLTGDRDNRANVIPKTASKEASFPEAMVRRGDPSPGFSELPWRLLALWLWPGQVGCDLLEPCS